MKLKKIHWSSLAVIVIINPVLLLWKIVYAKVASSHPWPCSDHSTCSIRLLDKLLRSLGRPTVQFFDHLQYASMRKRYPSTEVCISHTTSVLQLVLFW